METLSQTSKDEAQKVLFISMALSAWSTQNTRVTKLLDTLPDDVLMTETAPGRNRGVYLIGHLIAVTDGLLPLFGLGERLYPNLERIFLTSADKLIDDIPSISELKKCWQALNSRLTEYFNNFKPDDWFTRHNSVSPDDFAKEPHRNKLNVLLNRTSHTSYHLGQLAYLVKK